MEDNSEGSNDLQVTEWVSCFAELIITISNDWNVIKYSSFTEFTSAFHGSNSPT